MKRLTLALSSLLVLLSFAVAAETSYSKRAMVVAVDQKAKTITFSYKEDGAPKQTTATWDDKTEWLDGTTGSDKPASAALAAKLNKDSKIFIGYTDRSSNEQQWWIEMVNTMPANTDMH